MSSLSHIAGARDGEQARSRDAKHRWSPLRIIFFLVAMVAALLVIPGASTAALAAAPVSHDHVVGTGTLGPEVGSPTVHVNAVNTGRGVNGNFTITYPDGTVVSGTVVCFVVEGNTAYVTGLITQSSGPRASIFPVGDFIVIGIQDNGEPGTGPVPDLVNFTPGLAAFPGCGPNQGAIPTFPIVAGNFQVFDR